ncbi:MAG: hypothetical protein R2863_04380 [Candidatus Kapaibacterium sp.]
MEQITTEAIIFMALGWGFVIAMVIYTMKKILTDKISYEEDD